MAYSPRSDLLTPTVAPDTQGYGPGITAGMNNFSSLVTQGLANKRQDQRDQKLWDQTLIRDKANFDHDYSMMDRKDTLMDKREATSKQDLSEFSMGIWEAMKSQKPDLISPEVNDKFYGANANTRNALALTKQKELADAMKSQMEADRRTAQAKAANNWNQTPNPNNMINDLGSMTSSKTQGQAGFQDIGNGVTAAFGPDGRPINPAYLLQGPTNSSTNLWDSNQQGLPPDFKPLIPPKSKETDKTKLVPRQNSNGGVTWYDPYTGQPVAGADMPPPPTAAAPDPGARSASGYYRPQGNAYLPAGSNTTVGGIRY